MKYHSNYNNSYKCEEMTDFRRVIKLVSETLKLADKNSTWQIRIYSPKKQLEKMSLTQLINFTIKIQRNMLSRQNELFNK